DRAKFHEDFCKDLPASEARVMAVTQKPLHKSVFEASVPVAAWKTIPTWFIVSSNDQAINPDLERFYAKRANAKTTEIASSHVSFIPHPKEVAKAIEAAAKGPRRNPGGSESALDRVHAVANSGAPLCPPLPAAPAPASAP